MFGWFRGREPAPEAAPLVLPRDSDDAVFHVERFERALEQCTNPNKKPELEKNLAYWKAILAANELKA